MSSSLIRVDQHDRIAARRHRYDADITRAVLQACKSCGEECEARADMHEQCRICAEACRRCEDVSIRVLAAISLTRRRSSVRRSDQAISRKVVE